MHKDENNRTCFSQSRQSLRFGGSGWSNTGSFSSYKRRKLVVFPYSYRMQESSLSKRKFRGEL
jgi:hypothetical protein